MGETTPEEMPRPSLREQTVHGIGWTTAGQGASLALQLGYTVVISRLLPPADFGLIALALIVLRFVTYLAQMGVGPAIVQTATLTDEEARQAQSMTLLLGLVVTLVVEVGAPFVSTIFGGHPQLGLVLRLLGLDFAIDALGLVPLALLSRRLDFRSITLTLTTSYIVGYLGVGILTAIAGLGVYSLVLAALTQSLVSTVFACHYANMRPLPTLRTRLGTKFLRFGASVSAISFVEFWSSNLDSLAVGRFKSAADLGEYNRASSFVWLPTQQVSNVVGTVLISAFAKRGRRLATGVVVGAQRLLIGVVAPITAIFCIIPEESVHLLFGPQWTAAGRVAPVLALAAFTNALCQLPAVLAEAHAVLRPKLIMQTLQLIVLAGLLGLVVLNHGTLEWFATAWLAAEAWRLCGYCWILRKHFDVPIWEMIATYTGAIVGLWPVYAIGLIVSRISLSGILGPDVDALVVIAAMGIVWLGGTVLWRRGLLRRALSELGATEFLPFGLSRWLELPAIDERRHWWRRSERRRS